MFFLAKSAKELNCHSIQVRGQLVLKGTRVSGRVWFEAAKCLDLVFRGCEFLEDVSAIGAEVFVLDAEDCSFRKTLHLNDLRCDAGVGLTDCEGHSVRFDRAKTGGTFLVGAKNKEQASFFNLIGFGATIGAQLILERIRIEERLVLESASIAADFQMIDGLVLNGILDMGAAIGGSLSFERSVCGGPAEFTAVTIAEQLILVGSVFLGDVRLWGIRVEYFVDVRNATFEHGVSFAQAILPNQVILYDVASGGPFSFQDARVGALFFDPEFKEKGDSGSWPFYCTPIAMSGCRYERISVAWNNFVRALAVDRHARADRQPFAELEKFMRSIGRDDWADSVYFYGRRALGNRMKPSIELIFDRLGRWISGYGVRPLRLLACVMLIYCIDCIIFAAWRHTPN